MKELKNTNPEIEKKLMKDIETMLKKGRKTVVCL